MTTVELDIDGMTCAGCASRVEKALAAVKGVAEARVNLVLERASVDGAAGGTVDPAALITAVESAGYAAWYHDDGDPEAHAAASAKTERAATLWLILAVVLTLPFVAQMLAMMVGVDLMLPYWLEPALAAPVVFGAGLRFFKGAWHALVTRTGTMDLLVAMGTGAAYGFSLWMVLDRGVASQGHLYFEASAVIITLVLFGKRLESRAKQGTSEAIRGLISLNPETARRIGSDNSEEVVAIAQVALGDHLRILPGERIPTDGRILQGSSMIDDSLVTGESMPVKRTVGEPVIGGAINGDGLLLIEATAVGKDTTLSKIVRLVERAQSGKAPVQKLVDRVSAVFVPVVLGLSAMTFVGWLAMGADFEAALVAAVSVLVIACPCALGLATPTAIVAGTGAAARAGILIKDVEAMERAAGIDIVLFDKTGTLTEGQPRLTRSEVFSGTDPLIRAVALQRGSDHPLAVAFRNGFDSDIAALPLPDDFRNIPGEGVIGEIDGAPLALGNRALMARQRVVISEAAGQTAAAMETAGETVVFLAQTGELSACFGFIDTPRPEAKAAIAALTEQGMTVGLLSGDSPAVAERVAGMLGISQVTAGVKPDRKVKAVKQHQTAGHRVAMVGDGINDAPALVQADLGIAMGSGTDIALDAAPLTLMRSDLMLVPAALDICRRTVGKIRQNLFWAFIYNVIGLPLAALGYLSPAVAGAAMAMSSVSVVASSLLLRRWRVR